MTSELTALNVVIDILGPVADKPPYTQKSSNIHHDDISVIAHYLIVII